MGSRSPECLPAAYFFSSVFSADLGTLNGVLWTRLVIAPLRMHWVHTRIDLCVPLFVVTRTFCRFGLNCRRLMPLTLNLGLLDLLSTRKHYQRYRINRLCCFLLFLSKRAMFGPLHIHNLFHHRPKRPIHSLVFHFPKGTGLGYPPPPATLLQLAIVRLPIHKTYWLGTM